MSVLVKRRDSSKWLWWSTIQNTGLIVSVKINCWTDKCIFDVFLTVHHSIDLFQLPTWCTIPLFYNIYIHIYVLHYNSRHVSSNTMLIIRRSNCIVTASGIVTLCRRPYGAPVENGSTDVQRVKYSHLTKSSKQTWTTWKWGEGVQKNKKKTWKFPLRNVLHVQNYAIMTNTEST
jgi:hypothetical protein